MMCGRMVPARVTVVVALVMLASSLGLGCGVERAEPSAVGDPPAASPASAAELELPKAVGDLSFQDGSTTQFPPTEADRSSNRADSERLRAASEVSENSGFPAVAADLARLLPKVEQVEGDFTISQAPTLHGVIWGEHRGRFRLQPGGWPAFGVGWRVLEGSARRGGAGWAGVGARAVSVVPVVFGFVCGQAMRAMRW